jgi:hypothetical protein
MKKLIILSILLCFISFALQNNLQRRTRKTKKCTTGQIWDKNLKKCKHKKGSMTIQRKRSMTNQRKRKNKCGVGMVYSKTQKKCKLKKGSMTNQRKRMDKCGVGMVYSKTQKKCIPRKCPVTQTFDKKKKICVLKVNESKDFTFAVISDIHVSDYNPKYQLSKALTIARSLRDKINKIAEEKKISFVIATGDLVHYGVEMNKFKKIFDGLKVPLIPIMGINF